MVPAGVQLGPRRQDGRRLPHQRAGRAVTRRTASTSRSRARLLRGRAAQWRPRLHALRQLPAQPRRQARDPRRLHGEPGHHGSAGRGRRLDQPGRDGLRQDRGPGRGAGAGRSCSSRPSSTKPASRRSAATCCRRPRPPAPRWRARRARRASAPCCRASSRARTSTRCRRSPR